MFFLFMLIFSWFFVFSPGVSEASEPLPGDITLNQLGYPVSGHKIAMVNTDAQVFTVRRAGDNKTVFTGKLDEPRWWLFSGEWVKVADFSELTEPGRYYVYADGSKSYEFEISDSVYDDLCAASIKYFYYMRASTELDKKNAGKWHRKAGHPDNRVKVHSSAASKGRPSGTIISSPKGWYDAGDYNKYVVNSGITTYTLLALYEAYPDYMKKLSTNIPESGNNVPDILDEALWNIEWLLTMQDPGDGGVYHKLTTKNFSPFVMPHEAKKDRYVVKKSTSAALNFAAVMAQASRVYAEYETQFPGLSQKCLAKAVKAWQWAGKNPKVYYTVKQPEGISTGAYDDKYLKDEFCWAALELYITTGDDKYYTRSNINSVSIRAASWRRVSSLGYISLFHNRERLTPIADWSSLKKRYLDFADHLYDRYSDCDYRITNERFEWGSNALCMNEAIVGMVAFELTGDDKFFEVAQANLGYVLGRNPLNRSFVTGFGFYPPKKIHHRISYADDVADPVPGMMVGGPNHQDTWDCGAESYSNLSRPALAYLDEKCSVSTNEVAINWNASLVYAACSISANIQKNKNRTPAAEVSRISIEGNKFVTPDGRQIIFKGVALPDPVRLDAEGHWSPKYFDEIKAWNCNIVRIPVSPRSWREFGRDKFFGLIDRAISLAKQRDMYIVIDWHSIGNLHEELFQGDSRKTTKKETLAFWAAVAKRYKGENTIAFYEIFNEPTTFFGKLGEMTWDQWRDIAKRIVIEIRKYDSETIPVVAGLKWGYDLTEVKDKPFDIDGIAYSIHPYPMKSKEPWEENWEQTWGYVADKYPMIALEFGYNIEGEKGAHVPTIGTDDFGRRIINYFSKKGISWTVWCFDWYWSPVLLKDDSYEPTETQGAFFKNVLQNNITNFKIPRKEARQ